MNPIVLITLLLQSRGCCSGWVQGPRRRSRAKSASASGSGKSSVPSHRWA